VKPSGQYAERFASLNARICSAQIKAVVEGSGDRFSPGGNSLTSEVAAFHCIGGETVSCQSCMRLLSLRQGMVFSFSSSISIAVITTCLSVPSEKSRSARITHGRRCWCR
jgi:hypothetical protein